MSQLVLVAAFHPEEDVNRNFSVAQDYCFQDGEPIYIVKLVTLGTILKLTRDVFRINTLDYAEEKFKAEHIHRLATYKPSIISYRLGEFTS